MSGKLGVSITWLGHATVLFRTAEGRTVLVDAWVDGNPACPPAAKKLDQVDSVLITHGHSDHLGEIVSIAKRYHPEIACNFEISLYLAGKGVEKLHAMNKGGSVGLPGVKATMVHALHSSTIQDGDQLIPAGEACGFVLEFENGTRVYHAGDTGIFGDMKLIGELYHPTVAVLPIGDLYTMGPMEASAAAKMLGVKYVVPIHHSTFPALTGTPAELKKRLAVWPTIEVVELKPGDTAS
ncbi:MAG TPA: metal-dependent hydrolase [Candidatus Eisenbacteria bacterium]|nr:metal-dependent hydrolase [Candidatus Eisenbacteria bacterium]